MSNFYLDVIKDRLYCDEKDGLERRSAQTAMYIILDSMVRMLAPILCFTADEIWHAMPHSEGDNADNVVFNHMARIHENYALNGEHMAKWDDVIALRDDINAVLEAARASKQIGKPLEAKVELYASGEQKDKLSAMTELLRMLLIVSDVQVKEEGEGTACPSHEGVSARVFKAEGEKCERCWTFTHDVGSDPDHPTLCARCARVVKKLNIDIE